MGREEKSEVRESAEGIRERLRRRFGATGLDQIIPEIELEIELVAQVGRVAEAIERANEIERARILKDWALLEEGES